MVPWVTSDVLTDFIQADRDKGLGTHGIHVHREGHPPLEHRFRPDERINLYSVAKTFTAVALGLAEAEGRLTLDDRLLDHLPELRPRAADGFADVTLRHLTTMTSGTGHRWFAHEPIEAADLLHEIVTTPMVAAAGTRFAYTGSGPYAVGRVIARVTGTDLRAYLLPRLFGPLGLPDPIWQTCPLGFPVAESGLFLRTAELARFARLLLQHGEWDGRQVLPAALVTRLTSESVPSALSPAALNPAALNPAAHDPAAHDPAVTHDPATHDPATHNVAAPNPEGGDSGGWYAHGYGLGVWLDGAGGYRMDGAYGQYAVIAPTQRATVTVTAHSERDGDLLDAIYEHVLARLP